MVRVCEKNARKLKLAPPSRASVRTEIVKIMSTISTVAITIPKIVPTVRKIAIRVYVSPGRAFRGGFTLPQIKVT